MDMKRGELRIVSEIMKAEEGLTFSELKTKTELSHTAVSNYLTALQSNHIIMRDSKTKRYHLWRASMQPSELTSYERDITEIIGASAQYTASIIREKKRAVAKEALGGYCLHNCSLLIAKILDCIQGGCGELPESGDLDVKDIDDYFEKLNEAMHNWLIPWIQMLAFGYLYNPDVSDDVFFEVIQKFADMAMDVSWVAGLEKKEG